MRRWISLTLAPTSLLLVVLAAGAWPAPNAERSAQVVILRRTAVRSYEDVAEEARWQIRARLQLLDPGSLAPSELLTWLRKRSPDVVIAIGQGAYDRLEATQLSALPFPLLHSYVYHRAQADHHEIPTRVPPAVVFETLKTAVPWARRMGVFASPDRAPLMLLMAATAALHGLDLVPIFARSAHEALTVLRRKTHGLDALWLLNDLRLMTRQTTQYAVALQFRQRLPLVSSSQRQVVLGTLLSLDYPPHRVGQVLAAETNRLLRTAGTRARSRQRSGLTSGRIFGSQAARITVNAAAARHLGISLAKLRALGAEVVH